MGSHSFSVRRAREGEFRACACSACAGLGRARTVPALCVWVCTCRAAGRPREGRVGIPLPRNPLMVPLTCVSECVSQPARRGVMTSAARGCRPIAYPPRVSWAVCAFCRCAEAGVTAICGSPIDVAAICGGRSGDAFARSAMHQRVSACVGTPGGWPSCVRFRSPDGVPTFGVAPISVGRACLQGAAPCEARAFFAEGEGLEGMVSAIRS